MFRSATTFADVLEQRLRADEKKSESSQDMHLCTAITEISYVAFLRVSDLAFVNGDLNHPLEEQPNLLDQLL